MWLSGKIGHYLSHQKCFHRLFTGLFSFAGKKGKWFVKPIGIIIVTASTWWPQHHFATVSLLPDILTYGYSNLIHLTRNLSYVNYPKLKICLIQLSQFKLDVFSSVHTAVISSKQTIKIFVYLFSDCHRWNPLIRDMSTTSPVFASLVSY